jgi:hypothetical protein
MNSKRVISDPKSLDVASSSDEFRFQLEIRGSNKGQESIRLGSKTRKGETLMSTSEKRGK